jgi:enoyl-CoA hydratase/carnithine racemase
MVTTYLPEQTYIQTHIHNCVMHIKIARLNKKNALTHEMYQKLIEAIDTAVQDLTICSILLYGETTIFTAGNDLELFLNTPSTESQTSIFQFMRTFSYCPKPIVVAVNGPAIGIGATLLLHADLVYMADDTYLSMPFVILGVCAEFASSVLLPALCGMAKASEILLLGENIIAKHAYDLGIVTQILPANNVLIYATHKAEQFAYYSPDAVQTSKQLIRNPKKAAIDAAITREATQFNRLLNSPDAKKAIVAFIQKRKINFFDKDNLNT